MAPGVGERGEGFETLSGLPVKGIYRPADAAGLDYDRDLGDPGEFPYTRGIHPTMYRGRGWTRRQFAGFGTAEETNARFRYLLDQGQTGLSVAFDFPTLLGYDSDHPRAAGEVGRLGVAVDTLDDVERLFAGIPLERVTTSMTINAPAAILLAMYIAVAERQGADTTQLSGTIQNDILKEYIAQKTFIFPPRPSLRLITDVFAYCADHVPRWNTISISGYHIREAGATAVQELAFTLADGFAYVEAGLAAGLAVDAFAPRLSFFFSSHHDFFEEIAKFRAARRLWARRLRDRYGARDPRSWRLRFHTQTAGSSLTAEQPLNNVVRTALQALAAVLGGTQSLHTNSLDEALALPSEEAVTVALRTQQIIAEETGVGNTADPLGGSYYIESLTDAMEAAVEEYFRKFERLGGVIPAIEAGFFQREIAQAAYRHQQRLQQGDLTWVGVNKYRQAGQPAVPLLRVGPEVEAKQVQRLQAVKARRDPARVAAALAGLRQAAVGDENVMPWLLAGARAYATLGEMIGVLREVFGEYREEALF